jgi:C-methyltransferase C-terminal domain
VGIGRSRRHLVWRDHGPHQCARCGAGRPQGPKDSNEKHIPIVPDAQLTKDQPDYIIILAWHYARPIANILRHQMGLKSKLVVPLPNVTIWEGDIPA